MSEQQPPVDESLDDEDFDLTQDELATDTIEKYVVASVAAGFIPIPLADMAALMGIQMKMLHSLAGIYEVPFSKDIGKSAIASLVGGVIPVSSAPMISSLVKVIPVVGQMAGSLSAAALGGAATFAIGRVFVQHFEMGGTLLDFDADKVKDHFAAEYEKGKAYASQLAKKQSTNKQDTATDTKPTAE